MAASLSTSDDIAARPGKNAVTREQCVTLEIIPSVPPELPVGTRVGFAVRATCATGSDLRGARVEVISSGELVAEPPLVVHSEGFNETAPVSVAAPEGLGEQRLSVIFPCQEIGESAYAESVLPVTFRTVAHKTSLAVWAVSSPLPIGGPFSVTVGAKSSGACELNGARLEISDDAGIVVGCGTLGDTAWPGTEGLYWTQIALTAPPAEGTFSWRAAFPAQEVGFAHDASSATFGFTTVKRPEHRLTVKVTESEGAAPIAEVEIALGPYRATTDASGSASLDIPAGAFGLAVWKSGFEGEPKMVEVNGDVALQVVMTRVPQEPAIWDELL
jgi:hypothetical protein